MSYKTGKSLAYKFTLCEQEDVELVHGLDIWSKDAPEGYEFTGEFRDPKRGEYVQVLGDPKDVFRVDYEWASPDPRLILRKIEDKPAAKTLTAAEVIERYGGAVLGLLYGKRWNENIRDKDGFSFTGKLQNVPKGEWYLDFNGHPNQYNGKFFSSGIYLTLIKLPEPTPRIITFYKKDAKEFVHGEAAYLPNEKGEMFAVDRNEAKEEFYWERQEVA